MKALGILLTVAFIILLIGKIAEFFRFSKQHKKQLEQLDRIITELRKKQIVLNQQVKIIQLSENQQKARLKNIYLKIYQITDRYFISSNKMD
jgi:hypothetical protein